jgi:hypothetical protein
VLKKRWMHGPGINDVPGCKGGGGLVCPGHGGSNEMEHLLI